MVTSTSRRLASPIAALAITAALAVSPATSTAQAVNDRPVDALVLEDPGPPRLIEHHVPGTDDRFDLAGGCFVLHSPAASGYVERDGDGSFTATGSPETAESFHLQALDLGKYLLFGSDEDFLAAEGGPVEQLDQGTQAARERLPVREGTDVTRGFVDDAPSVAVPRAPRPDTRTGAVAAAAEPNALAEWIVRDADGGFTFHLPADDGDEAVPGPSDVDGDAPIRGTLVAGADGVLTIVEGAVTDGSATFALSPATEPCAAWPEVEINVDGPLVTGEHPVDETRGYLDAHLHMMAFEFIGGRSRCGRPWHPYGVAHALVDCPDHEPGGRGALLETVLSGAPEHDTTGWPDFPYWPKYDSLTHEQVYYRWLERSWRGGLRMFTNLLVDNNALCEAWVYKRNSCNEMDGVRLQAERLRELERYIDAQWGGPGEGWFRIVTDPFEARRAIQEGRLAVVMGIEVSVLFDCGLSLGVPQCDADDIDEELAAVHDLGVRQMEFVNKFDNALSGVTGDAHETGIVVNTGNFADTGRWWQMETCPEDRDPHRHDKPQHNVVDDDPSGFSREVAGRDAIFAGVLEVTGTSGAAPVYPQSPHCNVLGLSPLGGHLLDRMVERGMLFDPDHMSTRGRDEALDHLEARGFGGVVSSHSWADDSVYERVLGMGGVVTPYAGSSWTFLDAWRRTRGWADDRYYFGFGYGADTNGFGSQGAPRDPGPGEGVEYGDDGFLGFGGVRIHRQVSGNQVYDINIDGVDHYGLYPDWIEDIRVQADADGDGEGEVFLAAMQRGPEAYLQTWERALGVSNDACRDDRVAPPSRGELERIRPGTRYEDVLAALGQPHERAGGTFTYCLDRGSGEVRFDDEGLVTRSRAQRDDLPERAGGHAEHADHDHENDATAVLPWAGGSDRSGLLALVIGGALLALGLRRRSPNS